MQNEIRREHQDAPYKDNEMTNPFLMRPQVQHFRNSFLDWLSITGNPSRANKVYPAYKLLQIGINTNLMILQQQLVPQDKDGYKCHMI